MSAATNPELVDIEMAAAGRIAQLEAQLSAMKEDRDRLRAWMNGRNETIQNQRRALRDLQKALLVERGTRYDHYLSLVPSLIRRLDALEKP